MRILIVGAGIGGLTLAKALRDRGFDPVLVEKAPEWKTIGYVLSLWPSSEKVLKSIGAFDLVLAEGTNIPSLSLFDAKGKLLYRLELKEMEERYGPVLEVERDSLHRALRNAAAGIEIRLGTTVTDISQDGTSVHVAFSDGKREDFDLVVGADGINSSIRSRIQPKLEKTYAGHTLWLFWIPKLSERVPEVQGYWGTQKFFGVFPSREHSAGCAYFTIPAKAHSVDNPAQSREFLQTHYADMGGVVPEVLRNLPEHPEVMFHNDDYEVYDKVWHDGRIVLIGDAAHAVSPITGLGANMAIEDAWVLAEEIAAGGEPADIFGRYESRRKPRVAFAMDYSRFLHRLVNLPQPFARIRNSAMGLIAPRLYRRVQNFVTQF